MHIVHEEDCKRINILVTIDKNYLIPLVNMLESYQKHHVEIDTHIYIAHSLLEDKDLNFLNEQISSKRILIHSIYIKEKWFSDTPVLERLPEESFYRLMAFHYLPEEISRCIYLDPDIYIQKSLIPLYTIDLKGNYIAAASHLNGLHNWINKVRLGLKQQERYVNSGIMLMDLETIRNNYNVEMIMKCLEENLSKLLMGDQDLINILFDGKILPIDECVYNLDERTYKHNKRKVTDRFVEQETAIIHYNGKYKPWLNGYKGHLDRYYPHQEEKGPAPTGKCKSQIKAITDIVCSSARAKWTFVFISVCLALIVLGAILFGKEIMAVVVSPNLFREWIEKFLFFDQIIFILIRTLQTIVKFIPAEPLEIASGYIWGAFGGMIYCLIGNILGSVAIIMLTKKYGHKFVDSFVPVKNQKVLTKFKESKKIYGLLFLFYLIPGLPKDGFTYLVGLLQIKIIPFLVLTTIARIPSVFSSTICGSLVAEKEYMYSLVILLVTLLIAVIGGIIYYKYFQKHVDCKSGTGDKNWSFIKKFWKH